MLSSTILRNRVKNKHWKSYKSLRNSPKVILSTRPEATGERPRRGLDSAPLSGCFCPEWEQVPGASVHFLGLLPSPGCRSGGPSPPSFSTGLRQSRGTSSVPRNHPNTQTPAVGRPCPREFCLSSSRRTCPFRLLLGQRHRPKGLLSDRP